jgi:hypothetical protein
MVNAFRKPPEPQVFYMPTWTEAELKAIVPLFPKASNEWHDCFKILGEIPQYVLEVTIGSDKKDSNRDTQSSMRGLQTG